MAAGDLDGDGFDEIITGAGPERCSGPTSGAGTTTSTARSPPWPASATSPTARPSGGSMLPPATSTVTATTRSSPAPARAGVRAPRPGLGRRRLRPRAIPAVSFLAYGTNQYGVKVSCGDVDGDGIDEIVTAPGPGTMFGAHIRGWNYDGDSVTPLDGLSFFAWEYPLTSATAPPSLPAPTWMVTAGTTWWWAAVPIPASARRSASIGMMVHR